jgi:hypothetical protein
MPVNVPKVMARAKLLGHDVQPSITLAEYHRRHDIVWAAQDAARIKCGVRILDPTALLCKDGRCNGSVNGTPIYFDQNHLSERGAALLLPMFRQAFMQLDGQAAPVRLASEPGRQGMATH